MPKKKGGKKKAAGAKAGKAKTNPLVAAGVPRFGCAAPQSRKLLHCGAGGGSGYRMNGSNSLFQCSNPQSFFAWNMSLVFFCALRPAAREFALSDSDSWAHVPGGISMPRALFHSSSVM